MKNLQEKKTSNRDTKPMKKISKLMALFAIAGMSTFLTGCGDDDGGDDGGGIVITAPQNEAQLRAQQYSLTAAGAAGSEVLIFPAQNSYTVTSGGNTFTGTYSNPTFSGNQVTVTLTPDNPDANNQPGVLTMVFSQAGGSGTYSFAPAGQGAVEQGTFVYSPVGDTTNGGGGGGPQFAPADQTGLTALDYQAQLATAGNVTLDFPDANSYSWTSDAGTQTGAITATRDGEVWTVNLSPSGGGAASTVRLDFTAQNAGSITFTPAEGAADSGAFTATTGGSTNGGTNGSTNGTGGGNAPADIAGDWDLVVTQGPFQGTFIATYSGGNFNIVRASDNAGMGSGTYTYTRNVDQANLVHNYATGVDQDNYNLNFTNPTSATFTGTQVSGAGATPQAASGTFVKR